MPRLVAILRSKSFVVLVCRTEGLHEPTICPDAGSVKRVLPDSWSCTALSVSVCFALCSSVFGSIEASEQSVHENNCIGPRFAPKKRSKLCFVCVVLLSSVRTQHACEGSVRTKPSSFGTRCAQERTSSRCPVLSVCFALCSSVFGSIEASEQSVHENNCIGPRFAPKKRSKLCFVCVVLLSSVRTQHACEGSVRTKPSSFGTRCAQERTSSRCPVLLCVEHNV